jgi:uncharacterized membrane protein
LTHGDYAAPAETGFAAQESGIIRDGFRLLHPGPVAEAAPAARTAALERSGRGDYAGRADRTDGDSDGAWDSSREQVADSVTIQTERVEFARSWHAPLPEPDDLARYEAILPGAALRILAMTEAVVAGPVENAAQLTIAEIEASNRGLVFAMRLTAALSAAAIGFFALGIAGVGNTTACITAGSVCLSVPVVMLIRSFITRA